jgi:hypothetical protein
MSQIKNDNPEVSRCASFVLGLPQGIRCTAIAALLGFSKDKTNRLLRINRNLGILKLSGVDWVEAQFYEALRLNAADRTRMMKRVAYHKRAPKRKAAKKAAENAVPYKWPTAHMVGNKKNARSINVNAPNSVWQYADFV